MSPDDPRTESYQNVLYSTLAHPHRRIVLRHLLRHSKPIPIAELASEIGVVEADSPTEGTSPPTANSASLVGLYHVHLPKLMEAGLIELDPAAGTVSLSAQADNVPLDSTVRHGLLNLAR